MWLLASALGLLTISAGGAWMSGWRAMGARAEGDRLSRMKASPLWRDGRFHNRLKRIDAPLSKMLKGWITDRSAYRTPDMALPILKREAADFAEHPRAGLRVTWLGHSTSLIEIDGHRVLFDPVWGLRASPFSWVGPARFHPPPLPITALPPLDAVIISHDHYDHLDYTTILALEARADKPRFVVPLGVGAHLERWGVDAARITELDWWASYEINDLKLVATPARHFSGRSLLMRDQDQTLWAGWAVIGPKHRVFYTGDTGMFPGLAEIGERLGPFDLTLVESGAYNAMWADMHLGPEQAVQAHMMLKGRVMLPVHWGTFDLAMHGWTEPMERILAAVEALGLSEQGIVVATPRPGESVELDRLDDLKRWWPQLPWETHEVAPVVSSGLAPQAALVDHQNETKIN
ncbi:MBL fold metallo-hydrolase [Myxococcota bacterium]|nr:MBL fold metallo-hydrolase [Myxococcota bacterium]